MKKDKNKQQTAHTEHVNLPQLIQQEKELRKATSQLYSTLKDATRGNLLLMGAASLFGLRATQQLWNKIKKKKKNYNLPCRLKDSPEYIQAWATMKESAIGAWQDNKDLVKKAGKVSKEAGTYFWETKGLPGLKKTREFSLNAFWAVMVDAFGLTTDREIKDYCPFLEVNPGPKAIESSSTKNSSGKKTSDPANNAA